MPGTSKNFEGGSGAEVWLSCEHRSFSWLIIFASEFNLPFFFFSCLILHPLTPWPLRMKQVSGHHDGSDVSSSELPLADEGSCIVETETVFDPASTLPSP
ncbi:unnamed protein product [Rangifer tarandus platyrhynchus]|uniref:Uncharacterized protein n=2 Tax=Rangifer tarandus platyrhynchus TaxID=3082113 RepID=A0ABN8ZDD6_RANTA|nr:unnamed protein product [Rangifer tarandus platyrhynchus]